MFLIVVARNSFPTEQPQMRKMILRWLGGEREKKDPFSSFFPPFLYVFLHFLGITATGIMAFSRHFSDRWLHLMFYHDLPQTSLLVPFKLSPWG